MVARINARVHRIGRIGVVAYPSQSGSGRLVREERGACLAGWACVSRTA